MRYLSFKTKTKWLGVAGVMSAAATTCLLLTTQPTTAADQRRRAPASAPTPELVFNTTSAVAQTAAVVEATVAKIVPEYTPETGAYTRYEFTDLVVHRGKVDDATLTFVQKGGERPDGSVLVVSTSPQFEVGGRYVIFLRNTSWSLSPVVGKYALRIESDGDQELLITQEGGAVVDLTDAGPIASEPLFESTDLTRRNSVRLASRVAPKKALNRAGLLRALDARAAVSGARIEGTYYNEPASRAKGTAQRSGGTAIGFDAFGDNPGFRPDSTRPNAN